MGALWLADGVGKRTAHRAARVFFWVAGVGQGEFSYAPSEVAAVRALNVPVRLAVTVMALAAATGCMSVGDGGRKPGPSPSVGQSGGEKPDGGSAVTGEGGTGYQAGRGKRGASPSPDASVSGPVTPSASASKGAKPSKKATSPKGAKEEKGEGRGEKPPVEPEPTKGEPTPPPTPPQPEPPVSPQPEPPSSPEPSAEPSSSAPEQGAQLVEREPAPQAGEPV